MLQRLAERADWCVVSTRIAQLTPHGMRMEEEAVACLLGAREANDDPTNFWIFSFAGLVRLMERAGWMVISHRRVGCTEGSDPVRASGDERCLCWGRAGLAIRACTCGCGRDGTGWRTERTGGRRLSSGWR